MLNFRNINILFVGLFLGVLLFSKLSLFSITLLFIAWSITTMLGSFNIRWNYFLRAKNHFSESSNNIYLTFDDGPNEEFTPKVLELLKAHNAKATFFCIGENIQKHPKVFQQIIDEGHSIGNHSFSHKPSFGFLSTKAVTKDIEKTQTLMKEGFGLETKLFRPPFGITNPNITKAVETLNLETIGWSVRSFDTFFKNPEMIVKMIKPQIKSGSVVLLHDKSQSSVELLELLLRELKNYSITSVNLPVTTSKLDDAP